MDINFMTRYILSIDPALSTTGLSVIDFHTDELIYVDKFITSSKNMDDFRINEIVTKLFTIAASYPINEIVLEDGFGGPNQRTALQLATLRGAIIGVFKFNHYEVFHMQPSEVRKKLGCGGNAKKEQIAKAIIDMYGIKNLANHGVGPYSDKQNKHKTSDMYDAISIGVAYNRTFRKDGT